MITASNVELRFGARVLMSDVSFRVTKGDKIGLVGRNGAGKTTLTKILAGAGGEPAQGSITRSGTVGYLPQDPKTGDLSITARDRILSARGLDDALRRLRQAEKDMASENGAVAEDAIAFVEWPDAILAALPEPRLELELRHLGGDRRLVLLTARDPELTARLGRQLADLRARHLNSEPEPGARPGR